MQDGTPNSLRGALWGELKRGNTVATSGAALQLPAVVGRPRAEKPPTPASLEVKAYEGVDPGLIQEWAELTQRVNAVPWLSPGWIAAWWDAFGKGTLQLLAVRRAGGLVGLLPVRVTGGALASPTNCHTPHFGVVADDARARQALAQALFAGGARKVSLCFLSPEDPFLAACTQAALSAGYWPLVRDHERSPYLLLQGQWQDYYERLGGGLKRAMKKAANRLNKEGELWLDVQDGKTELPCLLEEGFRIEASGWKGQEASAIASRPETRHFYTQAARWASEQGLLRLLFLRCQGRAIAFEFCLEKDGVLYLLKSGYDEAFHYYGPGNLLHRELLRRAFATDVKRVEFLGSDEPWKLGWTDTVRTFVAFHAFRPLWGTLEWLAHAHGQPLATRVLDYVPERAQKQVRRLRGVLANALRR